MVAKRRSVSLPIVLSVISVGLSIALLVGWILVIIQNTELTKEVVQNTWLLVAGIASFAAIMTVLVLFTVFLVRQIFEVRRQTSFLDSVTHELRSPLASLHLGLETLARKELAGDRREGLRRMMLDDVQRLATFIDTILQTSRVTHPRSATTVTDVDLAQVLRESAATITKRHKLEAGAIQVDVSNEVELVTDRDALRTVVDNLLDNAVKYSDPRPHIELRSRSDDASRLRIEISDSGIGISARHIKRIFERFYRVPEDAVQARRGTGLGLFLVSALVKRLGGEIQAHSNGPGQGTTMLVLLPLASKSR